MSFDFDYFVIGAGSGGVRSARIASQLGAKAAIAESRYLGGTCVNVGCVPKKLFVYASEFSEFAKQAQGFGWASSESNIDWQVLRDKKDKEIKRLNSIYSKLLEDSGACLLQGNARLLDANTVEVDSKAYTSKHILLATGGWPRQPEYSGAEHVVDSNAFFFLDTLPHSVLVEGGGYIAVEFAGILNGLGCDVELVYRGELFLRGFDQDIRQFVAEELTKKGIKLRFESKISEISPTEQGSYKVFLSSGEPRVVDKVVAAIGRVPLTDGLGIENTRICVDAGGFIEVDENFQTAEPSIYAVGDVVGRKALTPVAIKEGEKLARYLFSGQSIALDYANIPSAVFSQPSIGTVGLSEEEARERGIDVTCYRSNFRPLKHTISGAEERVYMKMVVENSTGRVLGLHMVGENAGEIIQGFAVAVNMGATKSHFDETLGVHPTAAEEFVTLR